MTLGALLDGWIDFVTPQREPGRVRGYIANAKRIKPILGDIKLTRLTAQHLERASSGWLGEGLSPTQRPAHPRNP
jgi:hypothetical protein